MNEKKNLVDGNNDNGGDGEKRRSQSYVNNISTYWENQFDSSHNNDDDEEDQQQHEQGRVNIQVPGQHQQGSSDDGDTRKAQSHEATQSASKSKTRDVKDDGAVAVTTNLLGTTKTTKLSPPPSPTSASSLSSKIKKKLMVNMDATSLSTAVTAMLVEEHDDNQHSRGNPPAVDKLNSPRKDTTALKKSRLKKVSSAESATTSTSSTPTTATSRRQQERQSRIQTRNRLQQQKQDGMMKEEQPVMKDIQEDHNVKSSNHYENDDGESAYSSHSSDDCTQPGATAVPGIHDGIPSPGLASRPQYDSTILLRRSETTEKSSKPFLPEAQPIQGFVAPTNDNEDHNDIENNGDSRVIMKHDIASMIEIAIQRDREAIPTVEAEELRMNDRLEEENRRLSSTKKIILSACVGLLLVIIGIVVGVVVSSNNNEDAGESLGTPTTTASIPPTMSPISSSGPKSDPFNQLKTVVVSNNVTNEDDLKLTSSPQYKAMKYLTSENDAIDNQETNANGDQYTTLQLLADLEYIYVDDSNGGDNQVIRNSIIREIIERYTVVTLFYSINLNSGIPGASSNSLVVSNENAFRDWLSPTINMCFWQGITCTLDDDVLEEASTGVRGGSGFTVVSINIAENPDQNRIPSISLRNPLPTELFQLTNLQELHIGRNGLVGTYPTTIGNYHQSLTSLEISNNAITGSIPSEVGTLLNLEKLVLANNALSNSIPSEVGLLSNLRELTVYGNDLSGSLPTELGLLEQLTHLSVRHNNVSGTIPSQFAQLGQLSGLWIYDNDLRGPIPSELGLMSKLTECWMGTNAYTGSSIPSEFGMLLELTDLRMTNSGLVSSIPSQIGLLSNLKYLLLTGNDLVGPIPSELGRLSMLVSLLLDDNADLVRNSGEIPVELVNLCNAPSVQCTLPSISA